MTQMCCLKFTGRWLVFFLMFTKVINVQGNTGVTRPPDGQKGDNHAFFALRSCHQLLHSDGSEFFSPDYLCSNPPLWCNWTIQVDPGKRIHLSLEDFTPNETCHLKQDQIHIDEPAGHSGGHKVLQKCWQEAKYTSSSNTLYIVLLIGGWPTPTYRGFYGRYQAFGPPVVYNPQEVFTRTSKVSKPSALTDFSDLESDINGDQTELANSDLMYDYYDQHLTMTATLPWVSSGADRGIKATEKSYSFLGNNSHVYQYVPRPTVPSSTQKAFRSGRGVVYRHSSQADLAVLSGSSQQQHYVSDGSRPSNTTKTQHVTNANKKDGSSAKGSEKGENKPEVSESSDQTFHFSDTDHHYRHSNTVVPQPDDKGNLNMKNHYESPHLPGDHLFEVAVEVNFSHDLDDSWDNLARQLLLSVKALITKQLGSLHTQLSLSSKRIKRLNTGVLYILWLQIGQGPRGVQIHRAVHSAMQGLLTMDVNLRVSRRNVVVMSVSTTDVNECGTQLSSCDVNADCLNHFGTYSCHCRPEFQDKSRLGSGGTICMKTQAAGCSSSLSSETKVVYVLFFLLSSLILMLVVVAGTLYHRHHRGAFLVHCRSNSSNMSPPDPNNHHLHPDENYSTPTECDLPAPPPHVRCTKEGWAPLKERCSPMDLTLLRFNSLMPPDSYTDSRDSGKM
ncbi:uncharacterized protein zgc:66455 [Austrofundulus limnaeus]|uniref:Uncharacterized protein zgc:66455 n=1 Tax=Austrofundulus limnaeus TaxID=52670 RepID=A0A2I4D800_AUSLI|nr:PREDICTED: uncharacterized protein LOC106535808 [Austrofundulus limnaeus]